MPLPSYPIDKSSIGGRPIVLMTQPIESRQAERLAAHTQVRVASATEGEVLVREAAEASVVIVRDPLPERLFDEAQRLRGVVRHGAGLDMIPVAAANRAGVAVANVPGANASTVAEYVVGQMIALARGLGVIDTRLRGQGWSAARRMADSGRDLSGKTVTIVGIGAIGRAVARICALGVGMQVIGVRRSPPTDDDLPFQYLPLDSALPLTDFLVLACPLTEQTRGLINATRLAQLRPGARLVNVSRGPVVCEVALVEALRSGHLAGAALDVFESQPLPAKSPLRDLPNVLLSPHMAGITSDSMQRMSQVAVDQVLDILAGRLPRNFVNPEAQEAILQRWSRLSS